MPVKIEKALRKSAKKKGLTGERLDRYVYGGLSNMGWRPYGPEGHKDNPEKKK